MSNYIYLVYDHDDLIVAFPDSKYAQDYIDLVEEEEGKYN